MTTATKTKPATKPAAPAKPQTEMMTGAQMVVRALIDHGVTTIFGYPGGAVLPIYDALFQEPKLKHILVRHEQGAGHAAQGFARATGKVGVALVTSGPGATNVVTPLADAMLDSTPMVVISGQVPTHLIGSGAFQECDTVGVTRSVTKHNWLVRDVNDLARVLHEAFEVAASGRPGPVVVDIPKDIQFLTGAYTPPLPRDAVRATRKSRPLRQDAITEAVQMMMKAKRPIFYTGGGVVNAGVEACEALRKLVRATKFPITSTLMGLGSFPASDQQWLGMLGMHGSFEANNAMHDCDLIIAVGARFDDRVTGRLDAFSPGSKRIHIDIDASSIGKNVGVDLKVVGDAGDVLDALNAAWASLAKPQSLPDLKPWMAQIDTWRARKGFAYKASDTVIKPQYAVERLYQATKDRKTIITTEVGQHQMWAAQFYHFEEPYRWITSGGLGTMGFGLPAAIGAQMAVPDATVIDIAGEASILMNIQEMSTAVQFKLPVKVFILNNEWMGMVRQWQQLLHGERYSHSYSEALPDFVKLADAYGGVGFRCDNPADLDGMIEEMLSIDDRPVLFDCRVAREENCFPMIPSGKAHNEMILGEASDPVIDEDGKILV